MFSKHKNKIYAIVTVVSCVGLFGAWFLRVSAPVPATEITGHFKTIQIGDTTIRAELALTQAEQVLGLSGRTSLATSTGMLFVFKNLGRWGIWMKDMNFPVDVLWITDDLKVSDIVENMLPSSYPKAYAPHVPVKYVLELPVGTVKNGGIAVGQNVVLK